MKTLLGILLVCAVVVSASAQTPPTTPGTPTKHHHKKGDTNNPAGGAATGDPAPDPAADQAKMVAQYQQSFVPSDPWRVMNGATNYAKGADWVQFEGRVVSATADGLLLSGWYGDPLCYMMPATMNAGHMTSGNFFLSSYPRHVSVGQLLSRNDRLVALKSGTKGDLVNLDYGTVWVRELTEEEKTQAAQAKSKTAAKVLAWQQEQAEKGDPYGEYKMGMRYLNGDGVDKNLQKARELLAKSADQGNRDATDELAKLPPN